MIVERRMAPMGIIPPFNEVEDCHAGLSLGLEAAAVEEFAFEGGKKTFAHGVVETVAHRAHRGAPACRLAAFAEGERGVLAALVGMVNHGGGAGPPRGHV